ncbi:MAG: hypothetical protein A2086_07255 [Spirochaetes bacterium GWD1_27_9]|nr:MAG: hypothetical protein A2Z98_11700 [Spirochaetes bacterium GWB1_27_13]OHD22027.1 MAG: hypothetical protein A2Y34_06835 [Spirochaetes bacterium GWC1_27_15]OHD32198.1 MAG: hypothetical protein A2086_07255 [Spirochaetes bacterium GWD1_27_9]
METDYKKSYEDLKKRFNSLAKEKAHLTTINLMYKKMTDIVGYNNVIKTLFELIMDFYGGLDTKIYYSLNNEWHYFDINNNYVKINKIDDPMIIKVIETNECISEDVTETLNSFIFDNNTTNIKERNYAFPLSVNNKVIAVVKIDRILVHNEELIAELKIFLSYTSIILNNELFNYTQLTNTLTELEAIFQANPDGMLIIDNDFNIIKANNSILSLIELDNTEVIGKKCYKIIYNIDNPCKNCFIFNYKEEDKTHDFEVKIVSKNNNQYDCLISVSKLEINKKRKGFIINIKNITLREKISDQLKESLSEKNILLSEIHHRVKNNLQLISSLINLKMFSIQDEYIKDSLRDLNTRVKSMGIIHEKLYQSNDFAKLDIKDYINTLIEELKSSIVTKNINFDLDVQQIYFNIDTIIPLGLLINEILTNSMKYAFKYIDFGKICIKLYNEETHFKLIIGDNGVGLPENKNIENCDTLGLKLIDALIYQLKGKYIVDRIQGTQYVIDFDVIEKE